MLIINFKLEIVIIMDVIYCKIVELFFLIILISTHQKNMRYFIY